MEASLTEARSTLLLSAIQSCLVPQTSVERLGNGLVTPPLTFALRSQRWAKCSVMSGKSLAICKAHLGHRRPGHLKQLRVPQYSLSTIILSFTTAPLITAAKCQQADRSTRT